MEPGVEPVPALLLGHVPLRAGELPALVGEEGRQVDQEADGEAEQHQPVEPHGLQGEQGGRDGTHHPHPLEGHEGDDEVGGAGEESVERLKDADEGGHGEGGGHIAGHCEVAKAFTVSANNYKTGQVEPT